MIILGVDPGLTRCGVGVIEAGANRRLSFIHVDVVRSDPQNVAGSPIADDLQRAVLEKMDRFIPDAVSIERVFAQSNRNTVLGTAQAGRNGHARCGATGIPVALHTPTEAKLAITGNGKAEKIQIERMVARMLGLNTLPQPADAADALAIAICHALRPDGALQGGEREQHLTAAQRQWAQASQKAARQGRPQRHVRCIEQMFYCMRRRPAGP